MVGRNGALDRALGRQGKKISEDDNRLHSISDRADDASDTAQTANDKADAATNKLNGLKNAEAVLGSKLDIDENERRAMLGQLKARDLTAAQLKAVSAALKKAHIKVVYFEVLVDQDAMSFANSIMAAVRAAGAEPKYLSPPGGNGALFWDKFTVPATMNGLTIYGDMDEPAGDAFVILDAFVNAKVDSVMSSVPTGDKQFTGIPTPTIFVGQKSLPFQKFPEYAMPKQLKEWVKKHPAPWEK